MSVLHKHSVIELFRLYGSILQELRTREIIRTKNNPIGDYAEDLFCKAFGWQRQPNSNKHFDALDESTGKTYQIKACSVSPTNPSRQLSALRNMEEKSFDYLAAILFDTQFSVFKAIIIPHEAVLEKTAFNTHTNSRIFFLKDDVWTWNGVQDVTEKLQSMQD